MAWRWDVWTNLLLRLLGILSVAQNNPASQGLFNHRRFHLHADWTAHKIVLFSIGLGFAYRHFEIMSGSPSPSVLPCLYPSLSTASIEYVKYSIRLFRLDLKDRILIGQPTSKAWSMRGSIFDWTSRIFWRLRLTHRLILWLHWALGLLERSIGVWRWNLLGVWIVHLFSFAEQSLLDWHGGQSN